MRRINITAVCSVFCLLTTSISGVGCRVNATYNNQESDKMDAERVIGEFYSLTKNKDYTGTYKLFSEQFFKASDTSKLYNILVATQEKIGPVETLKLGQWETQSIKGTDERNDYILQYVVKRQYFESNETFTLTKENGAIKIVRYNINSDGFFQPDSK